MSDLSSSLGIILTVLLLTSFAKVVTSLTILRIGLGLNQSGFGIVVIALSFVISLVVMRPELNSVGGASAIISGKGFKQDIDLEKSFRPFLEKNSDPEITKRILNFRKPSDREAEKPKAQATKDSSQVPDKAEANFEMAVLSFMLSELKEAFQIGAVILIPFLVVDLLVANALVLLGVNQLSPELLSLPFKLILFFAVDGWTLIAEKLLRTYI